MNAFYIALSLIKIKFRDKKTLVISLLFPIVLVIILGSALKSTDAFSAKDLGKTKICYLNSDNKDMSKSFEEFLKNKSIKEIITAKNVKSISQGKKLVNNESVYAFIYIDKNYSKNINDDKKGKINIYETKTNTVRNAIVESLVDSYNTGANTVMTASKIAMAREQYISRDNIKEQYLSIDGKTPGSIDYYAVTMLVLTIMYGALYSVSDLKEMFYKNVGRRIKTTKTNIFQHILGILSADVIFLMLECTVFGLFTKYVYGANWGSNPLKIGLIFLALSCLSTAMGIMVATIFEDDRKASGIVQIIIPILTFISGGYYKMNIVSGEILKYVPSYLAQTALFNTIYKDSSIIANNYIITMFVMAAVMLVIAAFVGRRRTA